MFYDWLQGQIDRRDEVGSLAEVIQFSFQHGGTWKALRKSDNLEAWCGYLEQLGLSEPMQETLTKAWDEYQKHTAGTPAPWEDAEGIPLRPFCRVESTRYLSAPGGPPLQGYLVKHPLSGALFVYWRGGWCAQILSHRRDLRVVTQDEPNHHYYLYLEKQLLNRTQGTLVDPAGRVIQALDVVDEVGGNRKGGFVVAVPGDVLFVVWDLSCIKSLDEYEDGSLRVVGTVTGKPQLERLLSIGKQIQGKIMEVTQKPQQD